MLKAWRAVLLLGVLASGWWLAGCWSTAESKGTSSSLSVSALNAIVAPVDESADFQLIDAGFAASDPHLRQTAVAAVDRLGETSLLPHLRQASKDPVMEVRQLARRSWLRLAEAEVVVAMAAGLIDADDSQREEIMQVLGEGGAAAPNAVGALLVQAEDASLTGLVESLLTLADGPTALVHLIHAWAERPPGHVALSSLRPGLLEALKRFGVEAEIQKLVSDLVFRSRRSDPHLLGVVAEWMASEPQGPAMALIQQRVGSWTLSPPAAEVALWRGALSDVSGEAGEALRQHLEQRLTQLKGFPFSIAVEDQRPTAPGLAPWRGERDVVLRLHNGIREGADLLVEFNCRDGAWPERGWGYSPNYNKGTHRVHILSATSGDDGALHLNLAVQVVADSSFRGGPASYQIVLRHAEAVLVGDYQGVFRGQLRRGAVSGTSYVSGPRRCRQQPLVAGEHPRLGLRLANWQAPQHTMRTAAAQEAMEYVLNPPRLGLPIDIADATVIAARRYDDFYYQADPELRQRAADALLSLAKNHHLACQYTPWHNYKRWYGGVGVAALAILGDPVSAPLRPLATRWQAIAPAADLPLAEDVPVTVASEALQTGVFTQLRHWLQLGSTTTRQQDWPADLALRPGQKWTLAGQEVELRALAPLLGEGVPREHLVSALDEAGYFYSVLDVTFDQAVAVQLDGRTRLWIGGESVPNETVVCLRVGRYPVVFEVIPLSRRSPIPLIIPPPILRETDDPRLSLAEWQRQHDYWQATGGASLLAEELIELADLHIRWYIRWAIGDCGFITETEGYTHHSFNVFTEFLHAYSHTHGVNLVAGSHAEWLPLRHKATSFRSGVGPGFWDGGVISALFSPWVRAALATESPADFPQHGIIDRQKASVIFRNGWRSDSDDIFLVAQGKGQHLRAAHTHHQTGSFRLYGFGQAWTDTIDNSRDNKREDNNVLLLPDDAIRGLLPARIEHVEIAPDGSGTLTLNMDAVYLAAVEGDPGVDYEGVIRADKVRDLGIRGRRAFAADFSGAAGVPGLVVVADEVSGGRRRVWQMHIPQGISASVDGRTFTLSAGGASLQGTVVAPAAVSLRVSEDRRLLAESAEGEFLVVMTLQRGPAPVVHSDGDTLSSSVRVGGQTIRYHQQRLLLAPTD